MITSKKEGRPRKGRPVELHYFWLIMPGSARGRTTPRERTLSLCVVSGKRERANSSPTLSISKTIQIWRGHSGSPGIRPYSSPDMVFKSGMSPSHSGGETSSKLSVFSVLW
jgi:hypothetical protein